MTRPVTSMTLIVASWALSAALWPGRARAELRVVATIPDFGQIAQEVGGRRVTVESLVRGTQDPHFVDPRPSFIVALNRADLLLWTGAGLEIGWLPPLVQGARNRAILTGQPGSLELREAVELLDLPGRVDRSLGDVHPSGNPHFWIDPRNGMRIARAIAARLEQLDPAGATQYRTGLAGFEARLARRIAEWDALLAPFRGTKVVVYHRSWPYFLGWAGLVEVGTVEPLPGIPPSSNHIAQLIQRVRREGVRLVIAESYYPANASRLVAQATGARFLQLPSMVGAAPRAQTYLDTIDALVREIVAALGGRP